MTGKGQRVTFTEGASQKLFGATGWGEATQN